METGQEDRHDEQDQAVQNEVTPQGVWKQVMLGAQLTLPRSKMRSRHKAYGNRKSSRRSCGSSGPSKTRSRHKAYGNSLHRTVSSQPLLVQNEVTPQGVWKQLITTSRVFSDTSKMRSRHKAYGNSV